jgi:hypothetical protein
VVAVLVNTRGLTEIVILTIGLRQHLLEPELYALLIVMALVTTAMTGPLLNRAYPRDRLAEDVAAAGGRAGHQEGAGDLPSLPSEVSGNPTGGRGR